MLADGGTKAIKDMLLIDGLWTCEYEDGTIGSQDNTVSTRYE